MVLGRSSPAIAFAFTLVTTAAFVVQVIAEDDGNIDAEPIYNTSLPIPMPLAPRHISDATSRIIGGRTVSSSKYVPWIAAIYRDGSFRCTGVIIDNYWVLTAAHCLVDAGNDDCDRPHKKHSAKDFTVVVGDRDRRDGDSVKVEDVEIHDRYDGGCKDIKYDFGLLRLEDRQSSSRIICLSSSRGPYGYVYGFGRTSPSGSTSNYLKYYKFKLVSDDDCEDKWGLQYLSRSKICHESRSSGDRTCSGDSGGPLVIRSSSKSSSAKLIGVTSYGREDCKDGLPDVAARVKYGRDWIKDVIGTYKRC